jgi:hypothetical protein
MLTKLKHGTFKTCSLCYIVSSCHGIIRILLWFNWCKCIHVPVDVFVFVSVVFLCPLANKCLCFSWCRYLCCSWQIYFVFQRVILREAHRSGALLYLSHAAVIGLIACGHIFLFRHCYSVRCGFSLPKHEIFLYICSFLVAEGGASVGRNICT